MNVLIYTIFLLPTVDICIPTKYDTNVLPPTSKPPFVIDMILEISGLKSVNLLKKTFSMYMGLHRAWDDSRIQIDWKENETMRYVSSQYWDMIWTPSIVGPRFHICGQS